MIGRLTRRHNFTYCIYNNDYLLHQSKKREFENQPKIIAIFKLRCYTNIAKLIEYL